MNIIKDILLFLWIPKLYRKIKLHIQYKKKLKELRERDPFIYK